MNVEAFNSSSSEHIVYVFFFSIARSAILSRGTWMGGGEGRGGGVSLCVIPVPPHWCYVEPRSTEAGGAIQHGPLGHIACEDLSPRPSTAAVCLKGHHV